jgi:hypothetical protein
VTDESRDAADDETRKALLQGAATFAALLRASQRDGHMTAVDAIDTFSVDKLKWVLTAAVMASEELDQAQSGWPGWQSWN